MFKGSEPECRRRQQQPRCPGTKRWRVCRQWCINRLASSVTEPLRHGRRFVHNLGSSCSHLLGGAPLKGPEPAM
eukprot:2483900-Pyramimonas_sp.AAC.1